MSTRVAYGNRDSIPQAIQDGQIPKDSIIITKEDPDTSEMMFYDYRGALKTIAKRTHFRTMAEAIGWAKKYDCVGDVFSVYDKGKWATYIVQENGSLHPIEGEDLDVFRLDGGNAEG